ncbi:DMT family transporter [Fundidesulfovibrio soli]|uniref:DMT family transporter n=1 Tax=Fundidesulfovibrio soli TaxID=2922716 RepID=UPI001FAEB82B|nr:EamA family transporter [Fundidesulfovibrio soli]
MPRASYAPYAALAASVLFWGLSFTATKIALEGLSPSSILFLRFGLACLLLLPPAFASGSLRLPLRVHLQVLAVSVVFPGCYFALETWALRLTTATNASLIAAAIPMMVLALSSVVERRSPSLRSMAGVAASLAGVAMLVGVGGGPVNTGDALMLGAVASASVYMVATGRLSASVAPLGFTALQMAWGAIFFLPMFLTNPPSPDAVPLASLLAVGALGLFATVGAFLAYNYALSRVEAPTASLCINAVPVVAVFGAHLALGESVSMGQALGGAVILASVYASSRPARNTEESAQPA